MWKCFFIHGKEANSILTKSGLKHLVALTPSILTPQHIQKQITYWVVQCRRVGWKTLNIIFVVFFLQKGAYFSYSVYCVQNFSNKLQTSFNRILVC